MKTTLKTLLATTVLSISAPFAAASIDPGSTELDTSMARYLIIFGDGEVEEGNALGAIHFYTQAVKVGSPWNADEAAKKLSAIPEVQTTEKIEAFEHVVSLGYAQCAYNAAGHLLEIDLNKGIAALKAVADMGSPMFARLAGELLFSLNENEAAIDVLRKTIRMNTYNPIENPEEYASDFANQAYEAGNHLLKHNALSDEDVAVLNGILNTLTEILKKPNVDIAKTPGIYYQATANKNLIEKIINQYAK
jgi:hypothetical protein